MQAKKKDLNLELAEEAFEAGIFYSKMGEKEQALAQYKKTLSLNPNHVRALYHSVSLQEPDLPPEEVLRVLERCAELDPDFRLAKSGQGAIYEKLAREAHEAGNKEKAVSLMDKAIAIHPGKKARDFCARRRAWMLSSEKKDETETVEIPAELQQFLAQVWQTILNDPKEAEDIYFGDLPLELSAGGKLSQGYDPYNKIYSWNYYPAGSKIGWFFSADEALTGAIAEGATTHIVVKIIRH